MVFVGGSNRMVFVGDGLHALQAACMLCQHMGEPVGLLVCVCGGVQQPPADGERGMLDRFT